MQIRSIGAVALVLLGTLLVLAVPAHATLTPVNGAVAASARDPTFTDPGAAVTITCPRSTFNGRISADGRSISGTIDFPRTLLNCTTTVTPGGACFVNVRGTITFTSTASTAGMSAMLTLNLDSGFDMTISCNLLSISIRGPQSIACASYFQASGTLFLRCGLRADSRTIWTLTGSWLPLQSGGRNVTVS